MFSATPRGWLSWVALVPLLLLLSGESPFRLGWLHGFAAWLVAIPWIFPTLEVYGHLPRPLAVALWLVLCGYLALFHGAFARLARRLWTRSSTLVLLGLPALWVSLEVLRGWLLSGFPWNLAAYSWIAVVGALPLASWIGSFGVSGLVVLANTGVALSVARRRLAPAALGVMVPLLLLAVAARFAGQSPQLGPPVPVRVLQPNIANLVEWNLSAVERNYRQTIDLAQQACDRSGTLQIWPESAAWPYRFDTDVAFRQQIFELAGAGCAVLLNSPFEDGGATYNSAFLISAAAEQRYDKRHLVPYGEYVPLFSVLPLVGKLARFAGDFTAAREVRLLDWRSERLGMAICFEVVFPGETAELVRHGATVLVTVTNDAWYGDTAAPWQHLRAAQFRAAENRRPLLRAAITGVSAVIDDRGAIWQQLGVGEHGTLRAAIRGRRDVAPYSRAPWLVPLVAVLVSVTALAVVRRRASPLL